jgi:hypothetical protein
MKEKCFLLTVFFSIFYNFPPCSSFSLSQLIAAIAAEVSTGSVSAAAP